jgi:hypothetical protein
MSDALRPHRGTMILIFGIVGLVACQPFGIAAWIMGKNDLNAIDSGLMDPTGRGMTQAGMICGIIATILMAIGIIMVVLTFMGVLTLFGAAAAGAAAGG